MTAYKNINWGEVRCPHIFAGGPLKRRMRKSQAHLYVVGLQKSYLPKKISSHIYPLLHHPYPLLSTTHFPPPPLSLSLSHTHFEKKSSHSSLPPLPTSVVGSLLPTSAAGSLLAASRLPSRRRRRRPRRRRLPLPLTTTSDNDGPPPRTPGTPPLHLLSPLPLLPPSAAGHDGFSPPPPPASLLAASAGRFPSSPPPPPASPRYLRRRPRRATTTAHIRPPAPLVAATTTMTTAPTRRLGSTWGQWTEESRGRTVRPAAGAVLFFYFVEIIFAGEPQIRLRKWSIFADDMVAAVLSPAYEN